MRRIVTAMLIAILLATGCADGSGGDAAQSPEPSSLTIYSGRSEDLVGPLIERFEEKTGIDAEVQYGDTAELASTILEEGRNTPADVFFAQDAGALGAVAEAGRFAELPASVVEVVSSGFRSPEDLWTGTSGRARVAVYNTEAVSTEDLPDSVLDLTDERWRSRIGWAPTNGSFQAFVTALRLLEGEAAAKRWLEGVRDNDAKVYAGNTPIVQAVAAGEIEIGLVNHYYLLELSTEDPQIADRAANHFFPGGDPGSLVNVAGVGIIEGTDDEDAAEAFVEFLLSSSSMEYFAEETFEYPLASSAEADPRLPPLEEIDSPNIDLSDLDDLQGTLELLREVGLL